MECSGHSLAAVPAARSCLSSTWVLCLHTWAADVCVRVHHPIKPRSLRMGARLGWALALLSTALGVARLGPQGLVSEPGKE